MAKMNKRDYKARERKRKKAQGLERAEGEVRRKRASRNYERRR
tara:strand:- start:754 stop:882 length:129 start_codon:yes stop_codon:yes gene_type:complete